MKRISSFLIIPFFALLASAGAKLTTEPAAKAPIRYVVLHKPGPNWQQGVPFKNQPGIYDHANYYLKFHQDGKMSAGGPFLDNSGGMMITADGFPLEEIQVFAENDPAVKSGVLVFEIRPWLVVMEQ